MSSENRPVSPKPAASQLLFYRRPEALAPERHGSLRLKIDGGFGFAKDTNAVAVTSSEFISVMRSYPIVFAAGGPLPLAILGLEQQNVFVGEDGHWVAGHYVPAYIRRYPFVFITHPDGKQFILGIDRASALLNEGGEGVALFENGQPTAATEQALSFCGAYQADHAATTAFAQALDAENLLVDNHAEAKLPNGRIINLHGFRVVDRQKFANLSETTIVEWHKKGWLALANYHLASLDRFTTLLEVQGAGSR
jgi:hypothetical protein